MAGFFFLLLYLLAVPAARAAVMIEPRVGFHGVFQLGRPFPLEIELSNTGRPAEGTLEVRVWKGGATKGGAPYLVKYQRDIFLGAQTRKTVQLTVDPDFISRPVTIAFSSAEVNASQELDLRRYFSPAPVLLFMSESGALPPLALTASPQSRLVSLAPAQLAADSRALLGVSHLIIYDQSLRELSRSQLLALDAWLTAETRASSALKYCSGSRSSRRDGRARRATYAAERSARRSSTGSLKTTSSYTELVLGDVSTPRSGTSRRRRSQGAPARTRPM